MTKSSFFWFNCCVRFQGAWTYLPFLPWLSIKFLKYFWFLKICGPNGPNVKISVSIKKRIAWGFQNSPYFWLWCPFCGSYSFSNMGTGTFFWDTLYIFNKALIFFLSTRAYTQLEDLDLTNIWPKTQLVPTLYCLPDILSMSEGIRPKEIFQDSMIPTWRSSPRCNL